MIPVEPLARPVVPRRFVLAFMAVLSAAARMSAELYFGVLVAHLQQYPVNGIGD